MSAKETYTKINISQNRHLICSHHLCSESKNNIYSAFKIINTLITEREDDSAKLKKECDYIFVGALIAAMAQTDIKHFWELRTHALQGTDAHFGDFLYPIAWSEVYRDSVDESLTGLDSYKHSLSFIGRRALETKDLPFTGSFNPACFPGVDALFGAGYFDEYGLNTDPSRMIHPLTTHKAEVKIAQQTRLASDLTKLESDLTSQLQSALSRSNDIAKLPLTYLCQEIIDLTNELKFKLQQHNATTNDIDTFKSQFKQIIEKPDYQTAMKAHRGQLIWRSVMDALENIETWVRQLPSLVSQPTFSLASKDRFFSTKTAKVAENVLEQVDQMSLQLPLA